MPTQPENSPPRPAGALSPGQITLIALIIAFFIILLWGGSYLVIARIFPDLESSGLFGNSFGAIGSLFSALALAGVVLAILLQNRELALQRSDLSASRLEIGEQAQQFREQKAQFESQKLQFELQNETLIQQRFENTFFHLLTLHHEIVGSIADRKMEKGEAVESRGRAVFPAAYLPLKERYRALKPASPEDEEALEADIESIRKQFSWFFRRFGPYFTNFFSIVEFVDHNRIGYLEIKRFYISLLQAQLSDYEQIFLFYYAVTAIQKDRYAELAEKYCLFEGLIAKDLLDPSHTGYFETTAFTRQTGSE